MNGPEPDVAERPPTPEEQALQEAVADFLERAAGLSLERWHPLSGGRSADTIRVQLADPEGGSTDAVLHLEPDSGPHAGITSARRQFELLRSLEGTGVPAPRALWLSDASGGKSPRFMLTEFVEGSVPNPWRPEGRGFLARERERRPGVLAESFVETLARIHALDPDSLPESVRPGSGESPSPAQRELDRWVPGMLSSRRFGDDPLLTYAREWLIANEPPPSAETLVHGDYRIGNVVIDEGGGIAAVLDWELARVGDPLLDLATVCSPPLSTEGLAVGLWEPNAFVERYGELTGREIDRAALAYHRVLATFKIAGVWVNASARFASGELDLASLRAGYSVLQTRRMIAETLGLPLPREAPPGQAGATGPVAEAIRVALHKEVLPHVSEPSARETLIAVRSVLRNVSADPADSVQAGFEHDAATFLQGLSSVLPELADDPNAPLRTRLTEAIRHAFRKFGARAGTEPALETMRLLVGRSAALPLGMWP